MPFDLFTSIPPKRYSGACVDSWRAAGFHVVSVNHVDEAEAVRSMGVETVEFGGATRKPAISTILAAIAERGRAAGIINADCRMLSNVAASAILPHIDGSMVTCRRIDVDPHGRVTRTACSGFDAFFFDPRALGALPVESFTMGQPWWDYWLPVRAHQMGVRLLCGTPILVHTEHADRWSVESWQAGARGFLASTKPAGLPFSETDDLVELSARCYAWLCARPAVDLIAADLSGVLGSFLTTTEALRRDLYFQTGELKRERYHQQQEMHRLTSSLSWRITRPLRAFRNVRVARAVVRLLTGARGGDPEVSQNLKISGATTGLGSKPAAPPPPGVGGAWSRPRAPSPP